MSVEADVIDFDIETLDETKFSPMMRQYIKIKKKYLNHIVFFRLGDFYELFMRDAIVGSKLLDIVLTGRDCGMEERVPMCGVPHANVDAHIKILVEEGYKVAVCEQLTDPSDSKGLVERGVVRIVTPGTLIESTMLDGEKNNYICAVYYKNDECAMCISDISTGEVNVCVKKGPDLQSDIINELARYSPSELLFNSDFLSLKSVTDFIKNTLRCAVTLRDDETYFFEEKQHIVLTQFSADSVENLGLKSGDIEACCICGLFDYISETQKVMAGRFTSINFFSDKNYMELDLNARRNLELTRTIRGNDKRGSLLGVLDLTKTSMGKRLIRSYIEKPLINPVQIMERLGAVEQLYKNTVTLWDIVFLLKDMYDIERLMTRVMCKTASPRDLKSLSLTALKLPQLKSHLETLSESKLLRELNDDIFPLEEISALIENAININAPKNIRDGGIIKEGFNEELDRLRNIISGSNDIITDILERERGRTGIKNLKINYNRVFGYFYEVTRSYYDLVPEDYVRKQTLSNCERFVTDELKQIEYNIINAQQKIDALESEIFNEIRDFVSTKLLLVQKTASAIAAVDVLCSFAAASVKNKYEKPEIAIDGVIDIKDGRHPVIELMQHDEIFVPNDAHLDTKSNRMTIITGPNMSGKSTYMRQTAIIVIMAQIGCFVPASYAKIGVVDRIFTRVGASDDLSSGRSTFMVEMSEVAEILKYATNKSLVILDEVGRGTSTVDGLSIARAVAEYICNSRNLGCKTLFATHYHELITLEENNDGVKNLSIAVKKHGGSIKFLRKIVRGGTDDSYGIDVAKLAGLPPKVIARARELLCETEKNNKASGMLGLKMQSGFSSLREAEIIDKLSKVSVTELTDTECREVLENIVEMLTG